MALAEATVQLYHEHPEVLDYLAALVCSVNETRQISDISAAFEADIRKPCLLYTSGTGATLPLYAICEILSQIAK